MENNDYSCSSNEIAGSPSNLSQKELKELIFSRDSSERRSAAIWLLQKKHFDEDSLWILKRLIRDEERTVWTFASCALGNFAFANSIAYDYLNELVNDDFLWIKKRGILALGEYAKYNGSGITRLLRLTRSTKKEVVKMAVEVLGDVARNNQIAQSALTKLTKTQDEVVLQPAISKLGLLAKYDNGSLSRLKLLLKSSNNFVRLWSAQAIGEAALENEKAFSLLMDFPKNEDVYLRRGYSKKLAILTKKKPKETLKLIEDAVSDNDRYVRTNAVSALGTLCEDNMEVFLKIKELLSHDNADVRRGAADALLDVPESMHEVLIPLISEMVCDKDYYLRSKTAAISVKIAQSNRADSISFLNDIAEDKDEYVRRDLAIALGKMPEDAWSDVSPIYRKLLSDRESIVRREAVSSLKGFVHSHVQDVLTLVFNLSKEPDETVRINACSILGSLAEHDPNSVFYLILRYASDESHAVLEKVAFCLQKIFDLEPKMVFRRIRILQKEKIESSIFFMISKYSKNEEIEKICQFYFRITKDLGITNLETLLIYATKELRNIRELENSTSVKELYKTFLAGLRVRDINDLALIRFESPTINSVYGPSLSEGLRIFDILTDVPNMALRYKQIEGISDKHIYLGKMLGQIDRTFEMIPGDDFPESRILEDVLHNWRQMISQTMDTLKGRSDLKLSLRTKKVIPQDTVTLLLGLENVGESLAENIVVTILPSSSYKIMDKTKRIMMLAHERHDALEFRIRPSKRKTFRVNFNLGWDDFEKAGKTMVFADRVSFIDVPKEFKYIPNPYITGGPIKPPSFDMFFGREDVFDFISANISCTSQNNVLILQGERRTGKTSILYQISRILGPDYISVFMDGQEFVGSTLEYFFYKMAKQISQACEKEGIEVSAPAKSKFKSDPWYMFRDIFIEDLRRELGEKHLVILFDEFEALEHAVTSGKLDPMIFNYVRNLMQHEDRLIFIFAGVHRLEEMMEDYWSVMFNIALYWKIGFLKEDEARKLISKPVEGYNLIYDDLALEKIILATACHPYFVQLLCRFLVNRHNKEKRNYITVQDVNEELANVIEKAKPHFDYIWTLSSSYEKLLLSLLVNILRIRTIVTQKDLLNECKRMGISVDKKKFSKALANLTDKDILSMVRNGAVHYRFKIDFIRMWVERYQPLSKVVEELGGELAE